MTRVKPDKDFVAVQGARMKELLHQRATLERDDLEYVVERISKLKDQRLQECVAELIGWSDDDRAEIETFVAIAIEIMKTTNVSKLRDAARKVEIRYLVLQRPDQSPPV
jgi:hypothetical protein